MINVTDLRAGTIFEDKGEIFKVLFYEHIKVGRGSASVRIKVQNLKSGSITDKSFISNAKVDLARVEKLTYQYLYKDSDSAYFMNPQTFEQIMVPLKNLADHVFLKEGQNFSINFLKGEPLSLNLPPKMEFTVSDTGPSLRGNSAANIYKDAVLENGLKVRVPLFIKTGDLVRVDTKTSQYSERGQNPR